MTDYGDRQADPAGGPFMSGAGDPETGRPAILALADGSVWRGRALGPSRAVTGHVSVRGDTVVVRGEVMAVVEGIDVHALASHLSETTPGQGPGTLACLTAPGAVLPIHVRVAQAIARGEIGRP